MKPTCNLTDYLTISQAALEAGVARQSIQNALRVGRLPFTRAFGKRLIRRADLKAVTFRPYPRNGIGA